MTVDVRDEIKLFLKSRSILLELVAFIQLGF